MSTYSPRMQRRVLSTAQLLLSLLVLLPLLAGCQGFDTPFNGSRAEDDPLRPGGQLPPPNNNPPPQQAAPPAINATAAVSYPQANAQWLSSTPAGLATAPASNIGVSVSANSADDPRKNGPVSGN